MELKEIKKQFNNHILELGIKKNDNLVMHSNIISFGILNKKIPKIFIDSLIEQIGPKGSLVMPSYSINLNQKRTIDIKEQFSKNINGILSKVFFKNYNVVRSLSVLHSHLLYGKLKEKFKKREVFKSFGNNSDFDFFLKNKFKLLLLGCSPKEGCTYIHNIEYKLNLPYRKKKYLYFNIKIKNKFLKKKILYPVRKKNIHTNLNKVFFNNKIYQFVKKSNFNLGKSYLVNLSHLEINGNKLLKKNPKIMIK
jgi:aminoglycoside N3'-acetyltransferase